MLVRTWFQYMSFQTGKERARERERQRSRQEQTEIEGEKRRETTIQIDSMISNR